MSKQPITVRVSSVVALSLTLTAMIEVLMAIAGTASFKEAFFACVAAWMAFVNWSEEKP